MTNPQNPEALKSLWSCQVNDDQIDDSTLNSVIQKRAHKSVRNAVKYFWSASFYQNFMYAFCAWNLFNTLSDYRLNIICASIILIYVPYTIVMLKRFRSLNSSSSESLLSEAEHRLKVITSFLKFKKWYEGITLLPVTLFLTLLIYVRWVPEAVSHRELWIVITWVITAIAFYAVTAAENRKRFSASVVMLNGLIEDLKRSE